MLSETCKPAPEPENLADVALRLFGKENGVDLDLPPRLPGREPPSVD